MDINTYIASGILELYVAGVLTDEENASVYKLMQQHPEILQEVLEIEASIITLTEAVASKTKSHSFTSIKNALSNNIKDGKVIPLTKPRYNWVTYTGWAASILLAGGLLWLGNTNNQLQSKIQIAETQQSLLETQIENAKYNLEEANTLISVLRNDNITKIPLEGQGNFASTYAKVYWDRTSNRIFLDAEGLPAPPNGKVYQVWSLTLNPLSPTSLGTIDNFTTDANKIFELENTNNSEAFGITLEPAGGSETPTMDQLYTLGVVTVS